MNSEEIVKNMIAYHNNELLDWEMLLYKKLDNKSKEDIINYVQESILELQNYLGIFKK